MKYIIIIAIVFGGLFSVSAQDFEQALAGYEDWLKNNQEYSVRVEVRTAKNGNSELFQVVQMFKKADNMLVINNGSYYLSTPKYSLNCNKRDQTMSVKRYTKDELKVRESMGYHAPLENTYAFTSKKMDDGVLYTIVPSDSQSEYKAMKYFFNQSGKLEKVIYELDFLQSNGFTEVVITYKHEDIVENSKELDIESYVKIKRNQVQVQEKYTGYQLYNNIEKAE
jgi:hypothetical protein